MDTVDVVPGTGVGPVRLGMSRAEVHATLGLPTQTLAPAPGEPPTEAWNEGALRVHYVADSVERIELHPGPALRALLDGRDVSTTRVTELVRHLYSTRAHYDPNDPELGYRFHFPQLGLTLRRVKLPEGPNDSEGQSFTSLTLGRPVSGR
ncbi:hypothetical protein ACN28E_04455 [Archangium lansingense]|uniref:hypothetical protein n=1 Tax=Archangium lansingense TaxID=2995310 RepID=UPI003B7F8474